MRERFKKMWVAFKKDWQLDLMILLPLAYVLIFYYAPMFGLQIAFRDYSSRAGIINSAWVGLEKFVRFFKTLGWEQYVINTVKISLYSILVGFPIPIILALLIHLNEHPKLKKLVQNVSYIPHFISVVVMVGILHQIFNPFGGLWETICSGLDQATTFLAQQQLFGGPIADVWAKFWTLINWKDAVNLLGNPKAFIHLYVWSDVWQSMGWNTIIYISALSSVSEELHEAARLDGANRWKRVIYVDIPAIMPTICIMLILRFGSVMSVGYEKVYLMQNNLNLEHSEVISTYVYKYGIGKNDMSFGTAVGLMNSVINLVFVLVVNWITNKMSDGENGLF